MSEIYDENENDIFQKIIVVGDSSVGKSAIITRYTRKKYEEKYVPTIGVDMGKQTLVIGDQKVRQQIWDTAGQERFQSLTSSYFKGAKGVCLVFDLTNKKSFDNAKLWIRNIRNYADQNICKVLIGNKCDIEQNVDKQQIDKFAEANNIKYFQASAKTDQNIKEAFLFLAEQINKTYFQEFIQNSKMKIKSDTQVKNKKCC